MDNRWLCAGVAAGMLLAAGSLRAQDDPQKALADAMAAMTKMMGATQSVQVVDFRELKALLPDPLAGMKRKEATGEKSGAFGMNVAVARGEYEGAGDARLRVEITDMGGMGGLRAFAQVGWTMAEIDRETDDGYEKTAMIGGYKGFEKFNKTSKDGSAQIIVGKRFLVQVDGANCEMTVIKKALGELPLKKLEALSPASL
jgi:hypothetical protein